MLCEDMNFRQIEAFRNVVNAGSMTAAAQLMSISQPAVSRLLADLEKNVGFPVFQKRGRNLVMTKEGEALFQAVDRAFVGLEDIKLAAESIRNYQTGTLNLITMPGLASRLLPELINCFAKDNPNVGVWLEVLPRSEVLKAMDSEQYDLGIVSGPVASDALVSEPLCRLQAYYVLPASHSLAKKEVIEPRDLDQVNFISLAKDSLFRFTVINFLEQNSVRYKSIIQARTADAIYGMVATGLGISIVGPELPSEYIDRRIVFKPMSPPMNIEVDMIYKSRKTPPTRLARLFSEIAHRQAPLLTKSRKG